MSLLHVSFLAFGFVLVQSQVACMYLKLVEMTGQFLLSISGTTNFTEVALGGNHYLASSQLANFTSASSQCTICTGTSLATLDVFAASAGSPGGDTVSFSTVSALNFKFYVGSYAGTPPPPPGTAAIFVSTSIAYATDVERELRFLCKAPIPPMPPSPVPEPPQPPTCM